MKKIFIFLVIFTSIVYSADFTLTTQSREDTYIDDLAPTTNYSTAAFIGVTNDGDALGRRQSLIKWDQVKDSIYDRTVDSAFLMVAFYGLPDGAYVTLGFSARGLRRVFTASEASWDSARTTVLWGTAGAGSTTTDRYSDILDTKNVGDSMTYNSVSGYYRVDISDYMQLCDGSDTANYRGIVLTVMSGSDNYERFSLHSEEGTKTPALVVYYDGESLPSSISKRRRNIIKE